MFKTYFRIDSNVLSLIFFFMLFLSGAYCQESSKTFQGVNLGIHPGVQNVFGGSFVNEVDVLAQESKFVLDFSLGYRHQFLNDRLAVGLEVQLGFMNGDLSHNDPGQELKITYENNTQMGYGLIFGGVLGKQKNIFPFFYINETNRTFDVSIQEGIFSYNQTDKQGVTKYGLGLEARLYKNLHSRFTIGKLEVDFGEKVTNINVEDKIDLTLGAVWQF